MAKAGIRRHRHGFHKTDTGRDSGHQAKGPGYPFFHGGIFISQFQGNAALPCGT